MEEFSVCGTQLSDSNTLSVTPIATSLTDGDKLINTKIKSVQTKGHPSDQDLLKGLLAEGYCHVCETMLFFEPQRHYEGEKHHQKVALFLQSKRAEQTVNKDPQGLKKDVPMDKDHFCKLCNMVFSSPVVAMSHYAGKVHAKNLRRQCVHLPKDLNQPGLPTHSGQTQASPKVKPTACSEANIGLDLKESKYCVLCSASFNNPKMALQHYNGRKHQRNKAREKVLQDLGGDAQKGCLTCPLCNAKFTSVEMFQAHMNGNKHQVREKKVMDLFKSQPKDYSSFADELADYIQVQKARGINTPATSALQPPAGPPTDGEGSEGDPRNSMHHRIYELNCPPVSHPPSSLPLSGPGYPAAGWCPPPYQPGPSFPHPRLTPHPPHPHRPRPWKRHSEQSSSSSYSSTSSSSSSSSSSSYSSDSEEEEEKRKRRRRRSGREGRLRERDPEKEEAWRAQRRKRPRRGCSPERRGGGGGGGGEEGAASSTGGRGKGRRDPLTRRKERRRKECVEGQEAEETVGVVGDLKARELPEMQRELPAAAHVSPEPAEAHKARPLKPKPRKEKRKPREAHDKRTEEERLWDESILGLI